MVNFCITCGTKRIADSQKFCGQCGSQFPEEVATKKMPTVSEKLSEKFGFPKKINTQEGESPKKINENKKSVITDYKSEKDEEYSEVEEEDFIVSSPSLSGRIKFLKESLSHAKEEEKSMIRQDITIMENIAEALSLPFAIRAATDKDNELETDPEVIRSNKLKAIREQHENFKKIFDKNA